MSIKALFFAGAATSALCTGAQAQQALPGGALPQIAAVGIQRNVGDVYAAQGRGGGRGLQVTTQNVVQTNVAVPVNTNINLGGFVGLARR